MKMIQKTYKFRLYPNKEQEKLLANHFGSIRFVYNHFLAKRKEQYEQTKKSSNYYEQAKELTTMKKTETYSWLKKINSQTLQHALRNLDTAYQNFFKGRAKFPRFHSKKHGGWDSSTRLKTSWFPHTKNNEKVRTVKNNSLWRTLGATNHTELKWFN